MQCSKQQRWCNHCVDPSTKSIIAAVYLIFIASLFVKDSRGLSAEDDVLCSHWDQPGANPRQIPLSPIYTLTADSQTASGQISANAPSGFWLGLLLSRCGHVLLCQRVIHSIKGNYYLFVDFFVFIIIIVVCFPPEFGE